MDFFKSLQTCNFYLRHFHERWRGVSSLARFMKHPKCQSPGLLHSAFWLMPALLHAALSPISIRAQTPNLPLPARPTNALSGTAFSQHIASLSFSDREQEILSAVKSGNIP